MQNQEIRTNLQASGIEYLSFSSMKELRNNEGLFLKKYINYEFDNNVFVATIIGKACHHGIEAMFTDLTNKEIYERVAEPEDEKNKGDLTKTDPQNFVMQKIIKIAQDYAKSEYIAKYKKGENFWNSKTMLAFGGYSDIAKLVEDYTKKANEIKEISIMDQVQEAEKELEKIGEKIKKAIEKHKEKDAKLDDFIQWGVKGSFEGIMESIEIGLKNWFSIVYPKIKNWKLHGVEVERTLDVADLNGEILELPLKIIIDAVFEDENGDIIIVDWKFKSMLSDDETIKPEYDMQGSTYFFGGWTIFGKKPKKALFIEIQPAEAKCTVTLQADLRDLCDKNEIDWAKGNNGKYMTNAMMQDALIKKGAIELKPVVYEYVVDFFEKPYYLDMWLAFYKQTIKRLYQLLVIGDDFMFNIFDQSFDGGVKIYQDWMAEFIPEEKVVNVEDAVEL